MQKAIHHWINYITPLGWHNQIRNDLVLNYQVNYEKEIFSTRSLSLSFYSSVRLGTLGSKAGTGLTIMVGNFILHLRVPGLFRPARAENGSGMFMISPS